MKESEVKHHVSPLTRLGSEAKREPSKSHKAQSQHLEQESHDQRLLLIRAVILNIRQEHKHCDIIISDIITLLSALSEILIAGISEFDDITEHTSSQSDDDSISGDIYSVHHHVSHILTASLWNSNKAQERGMQER